MLYFSRTGNTFQLGLFLVLCLLWSIGGILIVKHAFLLKARERLVVGVSTGFLLFIVIYNLLAHILPLTASAWGAALIILLTGFVLALRAKDFTLLTRDEARSWWLLGISAGLFVLFFLILRGLTIFDDHYHLPLISRMAAGDIPPHFYLEPSLHLPYHYGLQLFAAALSKVGGLFVWSAWDMSRAFVLAFVPVLGWLWVRRITNHRYAAALGAVLLTLGSGTRWLLLFLPPSVLNRMSSGLSMLATGASSGANLVTSLTSRFPLEAQPPFPIPFAYANGLLEPLIMNLGATGAMWELTILLLLLLRRTRKSSIPGFLTLGFITASLALSAEHVFAALTAGLSVMLVAAVVRLLVYKSGSWQSILRAGIPLTISLMLALFQGGYISDWFLSKVAALRGLNYPMMTTDFQAFSLRWPPAVPTGHYGPLSLTTPTQWVILLAEAGPALLLLPFVILLAIRFLKTGRWLYAGLALGSLVSFTIPIFVKYGLDFDITRLVGSALWLWMALSFPFLWNRLAVSRSILRVTSAAIYSTAVFGGVILLGIQMLAIPIPQISYFITSADSQVSRTYWDQLAPDANVLDFKPERSVVVFGRPSYAGIDVYRRAPEWEALMKKIDPVEAARQGYTDIYVDNLWWNELPKDQRSAFQLDCVHQAFEIHYEADYSFRRLYDIRDCKP